MLVKDKYFGGKDVDGEIGIEIEIEGENLPDPITAQKALLPFWTVHHDGSLRGESMELVLSQPVKREDVGIALAHAKSRFEAAAATIVPSVRTGVHVHINVRDMTIEQVFKFMFTWFLFESVLVRYCGEDREGNLFCLRGSDAEVYMDALETAVATGDFRVLHTDELRYSAMNPKALMEYGSLEFRCLKTPDDLLDIEKWVRLLLQVKDFSLTIEDPVDMLDMISRIGGEEIAEQCFNDELIAGLPVHDWTMEMFDGLRLIQPSIYARKWNDPENEDIVFATELPMTLAEAKAIGAVKAIEVVNLNL